MAHQRSLLPDTRSRFERFIEFHGQHPEVFEMFAAFARKARGAGLQRYSARAIWERLRWHFRVEQGDAEFKLNDHFPPYYARLLMASDVMFAGFFERRDARFDVDDATLLCEAAKACNRAYLNREGAHP